MHRDTWTRRSLTGSSKRYYVRLPMRRRSIRGGNAAENSIVFVSCLWYGYAMLKILGYRTAAGFDRMGVMKDS